MGQPPEPTAPRPPAAHRRAAADLRLAAGLTVVLALVYGLTAAHDVQTLDCGELTAAAHAWGVPHPPGFPTYVTLAGLFARVSPATTAADLALFSALAGAAATGLLCLLTLRLGVRPIAACLAACAWALLGPTWRHHGEQEVFGLTHLATAGLLVLSLRVSRSPRRGLVLALGALSGLAAGVHSTVVLAAPAIAVGLLLHPGNRPGAAARWSWSSALGTVALFAAGLPIGLSTHAYLLVAARWGGLPSWGALRTLGDLLGHTLRREYGTFSLGLGATASRWGAVARYGRHLGVDGLGVLVIAGAVGGGRLAYGALQRWRSGPRGPRSVRADSRGRGGLPTPGGLAFQGGLVLSWALAAGPFLLAFRTPDTLWWHEVIERFFPLVSLFALPLVGLGLEALLRLGSLPLQRSTQAVAIAWLGLLAASSAGQAVSRGRAVAPRLADDLLASVEQGGLLITTSDTPSSAVWEARWARGQRPDIVHVVAPLLPAPWYAAQVEASTGGFRQPDRRQGISALLRWAETRELPVYLDAMPREGLPAGLRPEPAGVALRVRRTDHPLPPPAVVEQRLRGFYARRRVDPNLPLGLAYRPTEIEALGRYVAPWRALRTAFEQLGDAEGAGRCAEWLEALQPWLR